MRVDWAFTGSRLIVIFVRRGEINNTRRISVNTTNNPRVSRVYIQSSCCSNSSRVFVHTVSKSCSTTADTVGGGGGASLGVVWQPAAANRHTAAKAIRGKKQRMKRCPRGTAHILSAGFAARKCPRAQAESDRVGSIHYRFSPAASAPPANHRPSRAGSQ